MSAITSKPPGPRALERVEPLPGLVVERAFDVAGHDRDGR